MASAPALQQLFFATPSENWVWIKGGIPADGFHFYYRLKGCENTHKTEWCGVTLLLNQQLEKSQPGNCKIHPKDTIIQWEYFRPFAKDSIEAKVSAAAKPHLDESKKRLRSAGKERPPQKKPTSPRKLASPKNKKP